MNMDNLRNGQSKKGRKGNCLMLLVVCVMSNRVVMRTKHVQLQDLEKCVCGTEISFGGVYKRQCLQF